MTDSQLSNGHGSRAFEVRYHNFKVGNMDVIDLTTNQSVYTLSGGCYGGILSCMNSNNVVVGNGKTSSWKTSVSINMTGAGSGGSPTSFDTHATGAGKVFGGSPKFTSPAFGGQEMTWKNKAMSTKINYTLIDQSGTSLARFESAGMKFKKVGKLEIVDAVTDQAQVDEIVVTVLTLLYRKLVEMNNTVVVTS